MSSPTPPEERTPPRRRIRALRLLGFGLLCLVLLALAAPLGVWAWLVSPRGEAFVLRQAEQAAGEQLAGRLEIGSLELSGFLRVELHDVALFAPGEQQPVLSVKRVIAQASVAPLLSKTIELSEVTVDAPVLRLRQDEEGSNLARALAPKEPSADDAPSSPSTPWAIRAPSVALNEGAFSIEGSGTPLAAESISLDASASGLLTALDIEATLKARVLEPVERTLALETQASLTSEELDLEQLAIDLGDSRLDASGRVRFDLSSLELALTELHVTPEDVLVFAPELELLGPVSASGTASLHGLEATTNLKVTIPRGEATLEATAGVDLDTAGVITRWEATTTLTDVQLHSLFAGLPDMNLGGTIVFTEGKGLPGRGTAKVALDGRRLRYEKLPVEELSLRGRVDALKVTATSLVARAAGIHLRARGTAGAERGDLDGEVDIASLENTRAALNRGLGLSLPPMSGHTRFDVDLAGRWSNPAIRLEGSAPAFAMDAVTAKDADFDARIERFSPLKVSGRVSAGELTAGDLHGRQLVVTGALDGRQVQATVDGELADTQMVVRVDARRQDAPAGQQKWRLDELRAQALGVDLQASQPTVIELNRGRVHLQPLTLSGNLGQLTVAGRGGSSGPVSATLKLASLNLGEIPKLLLPEGLALDGVVSGSVDLSGTLAAPSGRATLALANGRVNEVSPIGASLEVAVDEGRVTGRLDATVGADANLTASVDVPLEAPAKSARRPSPIAAKVTLDDVTPALLRAFVPDLPVVEGTIEGDATLSGTWAAPVFNTSVSVSDAGGFGLSGVDASVQADWADGVVKVSGQTSREASLEASLEASAPLAAAPLLEGKVPDWRSLAAMGELRLTRLSLAWLEKLGRVPQGTRGTAAGRVLVSGTATNPEASATLALRNLTWGDYRDLEATADLRLHDDVSLNVGVQLAGKPLLEAAAHAGVSASRLTTIAPEALWRVPLSLDAKLLPTSLSSLLPNQNELAARGVASAHVSLTGTAEAPLVTLAGVVDRLETSEGSALGKLVVDGGYDGSSSRVSARFDSPDAGTLVALATLPGSLSGRSFATPEALDAVLARRAQVSVTTNDFDLSLLNGLTASVRDIDGRLDLRVKKSGPLLEPGGEGSLAVRDMTASFVEYGQIAKTELDLVFAWPAFELRRLSGQSGEGRFTARGDLGSTDGGRSFKGALHAELDKLPLVQHFETKGWLSLVVDANLELKDKLITVNPLVLSKGLLKVADSNVTRQLTGQGKDVQSLDRNPDIVFTSEVRALRRKERREARRAAKGLTTEPWRTEIRLSIPNDFKVEAPLGNELTLGANLKITVDPARERKDLDPVDVEGRINVVKGTVNVLRRFDITKGQLTFRPTQWKDPELNFEGRHEGTDGTIVTVAFGGTASHPTKRFQLDPAGGAPPTSDEAEVLFYLTTGRLQARANTTSPDLNEALATAGMNALGSLGVTGVKWIAENVLPLPDVLKFDVLSVDTDLRNGLGGSIERVRAGKYISDRIYVGGQYNREANVEQDESPFELEISYRLSDQAALELTGAQSSLGAEFTYKKDIPTKKQRKATERK